MTPSFTRKDTVHEVAAVALATHAVQIELAYLRSVLLPHIVAELTGAALKWNKHELQHESHVVPEPGSN